MLSLYCSVSWLHMILMTISDQEVNLQAMLTTLKGTKHLLASFSAELQTLKLENLHKVRLKLCLELSMYKSFKIIVLFSIVNQSEFKINENGVH